MFLTLPRERTIASPAVLPFTHHPEGKPRAPLSTTHGKTQVLGDDSASMEGEFGRSWVQDTPSSGRERLPSLGNRKARKGKRGKHDRKNVFSGREASAPVFVSMRGKGRTLHCT